MKSELSGRNTSLEDLLKIQSFKGDEASDQELTSPEGEFIEIQPIYYSYETLGEVLRNAQEEFPKNPKAAKILQDFQVCARFYALIKTYAQDVKKRESQSQLKSALCIIDAFSVPCLGIYSLFNEKNPYSQELEYGILVIALVLNAAAFLRLAIVQNSISKFNSKIYELAFRELDPNEKLAQIELLLEWRLDRTLEYGLEVIKQIAMTANPEQLVSDVVAEELLMEFGEQPMLKVLEKIKLREQAKKKVEQHRRSSKSRRPKSKAKIEQEPNPIEASEFKSQEKTPSDPLTFLLRTKEYQMYGDTSGKVHIKYIRKRNK